MPSIAGLLLLVTYLGGSWKFWTGFKHTTFNNNRVLLTMLWPILLLVPSYRQNFQKALKA